MCYLLLRGSALSLWPLVVSQMIVISYGLPEGMLTSEEFDGDTQQALMDLKNWFGLDEPESDDTALQTDKEASYHQNDIKHDTHIEDEYKRLSENNIKSSNADLDDENDDETYEESAETEEELAEDVKDLLNELMTEIRGEFDGVGDNDTGGTEKDDDDNDDDDSDDSDSESVDEMVEDEENVLEQQMGYKETKTEKDKQSVQLTDINNGQIVNAIVEEDSTVLTNQTANETIVIVKDKVTIVNETEGSKGQVISEDEVANEFEFEGVLDPTKECSLANPCNAGFYCPNEGVESQCAVCKDKNDRCISNKECCGNGMGRDKGVCYFGKCRKVGDGGVKKGDWGTHCNNISQCAENHCCRYMETFSANVCDTERLEGESCLFDPLDAGSNPDNYGGVIEIIAGSSALTMSGGCAPCHKKFTCHHETKTCVPKDATFV